MKKAVFFDLDGTLLDRDSSARRFVEAQHNRFAGSLSHIPKSTYAIKFLELDCRGHVWKDKVYQALVEEFSITGITWQAMLKDYETQFQFNCVPFPYLSATLSELKSKGYSLGIVTNGFGEFQSRSIEGLGIRAYLDAVLISDVEGVRKPQIEIFQRAMDRLEVLATNSTFVGDNPDADIAGAKKAGMKTIWKRHPYSSEPHQADAIIDGLNEIPLILKSFEHK
ncbi:MAG: HAD family hydrolase [Phormidesmis sp.]